MYCVSSCRLHIYRNVQNTWENIGSNDLWYWSTTWLNESSEPVPAQEPIVFVKPTQQINRNRFCQHVPKIKMSEDFLARLINFFEMCPPHTPQKFTPRSTESDILWFKFLGGVGGAHLSLPKFQKSTIIQRVALFGNWRGLSETV